MLSSSGCCVVAGYGMKNAKEKRLANQEELHERMNSVFDKISQ